MSSENSVVENGSEASKEATMSSENVVKINARPVQEESQLGGIQLHQPGSLTSDRPVMPSDIEVTGTMTVAGVRPIAASHLALAGSFLNGRPIAASNLKVQEMLPGGRPIFVSEFRAVEGMLMGDRPILASDPKLMEASMLPGGRPIASNEIDDPESIMGYLD